jgi:hypothetical protein
VLQQYILKNLFHEYKYKTFLIMNQNQNVDSDTKEQMQNKLTEYLDRKRSVNEAQIEAIDRDSRLIYDYLVPTMKMGFINDPKNLPDEEKPSYIPKMMFSDENEVSHAITLHDHAVGQLADKMGIPSKYLRDLHNGKEDWKKFLAVETMDLHVHNAKQERLLVRTVGDEARGIVSDKFKRMNSIILYSTFLSAAKNSGAVVASAHYDGLQGFLEVVRPDVIVIPTERNGIQYICFGMQFRNSDFGGKSMEMRAFNFIIKCLNGWVNRSIIREVHLGARLPDNLELSEKTYKLDTETKASVIQDTIESLLDPKEIMNHAIRIQESSKILIDLDDEVKSLPQLGIHEYEAEALRKIFMENNPDNNIQGENTLFKLTQGLSAVSRDSNENRKRELEEITGKLFERINVL